MTNTPYSSTTLSASDRCVTYVAAGERFRDEAELSLASLRRFMPRVHAVLMTDVAPATPGGFDEVVSVHNTFADFKVGAPPWSAPGWLTRIDAMIAAIERGAHRRVLFLETDVEVTGDISSVFDTLERFDIAAAHAPFRTNEKTPDIPTAFPEFNLGVVAVRPSPASLDLLRAWRAAYLAQPEWWHHDQVTFRRAVWSGDVRVATLAPEFNLRPTRFGGRPVPRVLHGFARSDLSQEPGPRIRLFTTDLGRRQPTLGWDFAMRALAPLMHPNGILFDPMVDNTFGWHAARYARCLPQGEPWVGVVHNPVGLRAEFAAAAPEAYSASTAFRRSLPNCLGLFCMSEQQAEWLRRLGVPVEVIAHPVDLRLPSFSERAFRGSAPSLLIQIGSWQQNPKSFARLSCRGAKKILLMMPDEAGADGAAPPSPDIEVVPFKSRYHYDALLQRAVVFADVTAAAAHPAVLECLARATPIIVNRHPAIVEYLGADYPLLYDTLEEAEALLGSEEAVLAGHRFLVDPALRGRYSARAFMEAILGSQIYRRLPSAT